VKGLKASKTLLDLTITPFVPITPGSGQNTGEKKEKLANAVKERIAPNALISLKGELAGRLVKIIVVFFLWMGASNISNTRPVKDLDNLLKILLDVLKVGSHGVGIIEEDSFICEIYAGKQVVDREEDEGYRIIIEEYHDPKMLGILKEYYSKNPATGP
jgi:Holliday junction resolvase RusA-like endonuclease